VGLLEVLHLLAAPQTLARLRPLHSVALVAYLVFCFGTETGKQRGEQVVGLSLIHLLEVGYPLLVHLRFPFRVVARSRTYPPLCCHQAKPNTSAEGLFTGVRGREILRPSCVAWRIRRAGGARAPAV
jgi:hypothetical protein